MKRFIALLLVLALFAGLGASANAALIDDVRAGGEAIVARCRKLFEKPEERNTAVPILMYHEVSDADTGVLYLSPADFEDQLKYLAENGYTTLTVSQLCEYWEQELPLPEKCVALTFDDGYRSMYDTVFPMLKEYGFCATFYVIPAAVWSPWSVDRDMIREMSDGGMEIGSHTYDHLQLTELDMKQTELQLTKSKEMLEKLTGREITSLCYPVGSYNDDVIAAAAEAGYKTAVTTRRGTASPEQGLMSLTRIRISYGDTGKALERKLAAK